MAGTISLSMTQRLDPRTGGPLSGGRLSFIQAGTTSTPQNAYQDYGLTIPHPNPIILDAGGGIPPFYLDDGFIKIRLTDEDGVEILNVDQLLVVGPSDGSGGGGGGGVDPTTVFQTGDVMWLDVQGSRTGWVRDNGRTLGSATSGATERANADCEALFNWLWLNFDNTICPVSSGRGISSAADWSANKTIQLPNKRNSVPGGLDDMGNTAAGGWANVPVVSGSVTTAGSVIGETLHALTANENGPHNHGVTDPGHQHAYALRQTNPSTAGDSGGITVISAGVTVGGFVTNASFTGIGIQFSGSGVAHNTVQRTVLGTFFRKL